MTSPTFDDLDEFERALLEEAELDEFERQLLEEAEEDVGLSESTDSTRNSSGIYGGDSSAMDGVSLSRTDRDESTTTEVRGTPRDVPTSTRSGVPSRRRETEDTNRGRVLRDGTEKASAVTPTPHFPLVPEIGFPPPTYTDDAILTSLGAQALYQLWQPPNNVRDIEQLAAYFSVPPSVVHRELRGMDLIPDEYSGDKITVEWMLNDAKVQRERRKDARERFLRDNEGRNVEEMFTYEEWAVTAPLQVPVPLNSLVADLDRADIPTRPASYFEAENEEAARAIEEAIDAAVGEDEVKETKKKKPQRRSK